MTEDAGLESELIRDTRLAKAGNAEAQFNLATRYEDGDGVEPDPAKAVEYYLKAARQGHRDAQFSLAHMYYNAEMVTQDFVRALKWFKAAAERGDAEAVQYLAHMYYYGKGVPQSTERALKWFEDAADQGDAEAAYQASRFYFRAPQIQQEIGKGLHWLAEAAKRGHVRAKAAWSRVTKLEENTTVSKRYHDIAVLLLAEERWEDPNEENEIIKPWVWLEPGKRPSKKDANKFLLESSLNYQMRADVICLRTQTFVEVVLGDPEDLWKYIQDLPEKIWLKRWEEYPPHRYKRTNARVRKIAARMMKHYDGDARKIWEGQTPSVVLQRITEVAPGDQIPRMIVGALKDSLQIQGPADVKVDNHVKRVLGRLLRGREYSASESEIVWAETRKMYPSDPWLLDQPLFNHGRSWCAKNDPECPTCCLRKYCKFVQNRR